MTSTSLQVRLKQYIESLPEGVARYMARVPFVLRLGHRYSSLQRTLHSNLPNREFAGEQLLQRLRALVKHAAEQVPFYSQLYKESGVAAEDIRNWADWNRVPVITKSLLQAVPLQDRTTRAGKGLLLNTGGSSGQTLQFMVDHGAFAREWAHMHHLWCARGYRPSHLKLTLRGKRLENGQAVRYNAVHNELIANANVPVAVIADAVLARRNLVPVRWIHGYPSLVAEFAVACEQRRERGEFASFRAGLYGVLLGSEFPAPAYRSVIERVLTVNTVSWYGHSEMAVLARETARGVYESYATYGYAEAAPTGTELQHRLVCTSLHNEVHPFIRYDTGDLVEPVPASGGTLAFKVTEGRIGDFICDRQGRRHALTAIIFGRHHTAFDLVQHLQVREEGRGSVTFVITPRQHVDAEAIRRGLDLGDLDINWRIELVDAPIRTPAGKIRLKIAS